MAIEVFSWPIQSAGQPETQVKDNVRRVQFGDGYSQVSGNGLNPDYLVFNFSFTGSPSKALEMYAFLRRHKTKSFSFKPPYGELSLWRVQADSLKKVIKSKLVVSITAIFEQAFIP